MYTLVVHGSHVMQFARAVGDRTAAFYDVDRLSATGPDTLVAPPTFLMAADHFDPDHARRPRPGSSWAGTQEPSPTQPVGFHTEQHFVFHRPVRTGDRLTVTRRPGGSWQKTGRRAGTMTFSETHLHFHDPTGRLVVETRWVQAAVERRPDPTSRAAAPGTDPSRTPRGTGTPPADVVAVGQHWTIPLIDEVTPATIAMYAGASGDFHPLHCDDVYARRRGYPGVFAHGMYTMGMSGRAVTDVVGHERVLAFGGRITGQVWPGDTLTARARVTDVYDDTRGTVADVAVTTTNGHGAAVFDGTATVRTA